MLSNFCVLVGLGIGAGAVLCTYAPTVSLHFGCGYALLEGSHHDARRLLAVIVVSGHPRIPTLLASLAKY